MMAELDGTGGFADQLLQRGAPLDQRPRAQILAVEIEQVEADEDQPLRLPAHRGSKRREIRQAGLVHDDDLAVDDRRLHRQLGGRLDDRPVLVGPVEAAPCEGARLAALDQQLGAVAVIFDFVKPAVALGRRLDQRRQLKLDEPEPAPVGIALCHQGSGVRGASTLRPFFIARSRKRVSARHVEVSAGLGLAGLSRAKPVLAGSFAGNSVI